MISIICIREKCKNRSWSRHKRKYNLVACWRWMSWCPVVLFYAITKPSLSNPGCYCQFSFRESMFLNTGIIKFCKSIAFNKVIFLRVIDWINGFPILVFFGLTTPGLQPCSSPSSKTTECITWLLTSAYCDWHFSFLANTTV